LRLEKSRHRPAKPITGIPMAPLCARPWRPAVERIRRTAAALADRASATTWWSGPDIRYSPSRELAKFDDSGSS